MPSFGNFPSAAASTAASSPPQDLQRRLAERHLVMIAIGGAVGVGLFLGSSVTISLAGPAVILTYFLGAVVALIMAFALAEMAMVDPVAGSFGVYAERYLHPWCGFTVRATYGLIQIVGIGAEVTAVAIYFRYWFPGTPQWLWVAVVSLGIVAINATQVGNFGEFEYWFSLVKVVAIVVFILVGMALIAGLPPRPALGFANLTAHGGFLPHGWRGVWLALTLGLASFLGMEAVAVAAGEAQRPEKAIARAMRTTVYRLVIFYLLSITVMVTIAPWNQSGDGTVLGSPFVRAYAAIGIPYAALIMNLVVITAALSAANTLLYLSTRMLYSLARANYLPAVLGRLSVKGVPLQALAASSVGMMVAIWLAIYAPGRAFLLLYGFAISGMYFVWAVILLAHLRFRRTLGARVHDLPLRLWLFPVSNLFGILVLLAVACTTFYVDGLQYSVPVFAALLVVMSLVYWFMRRNGESNEMPRLETSPRDPSAET